MRVPRHIHALLLFTVYGDMYPYWELALQFNDWNMVGQLLLAMCNPLAIGYRD